MPAETNASKPKSKRPARPRFWVGPLVAGACFALGYGITQRVVLIRSGLDQAEPQSFRARAFPGESLEALRLRHGETGTLEADVAAKELIDAKASKQANALKKAKLAKELEADAPPELLDSEPPLAAPNALPTEAPELAQPTPAVELDAPVVVDSVVIEDAPAATDLFFTPIEAPPAP
jgi:hypothetical protein